MLAPATMDIPIAHVDDIESIAIVIEALRRLHGSGYDFEIGRWDGRTRFEPRLGQATYRFIIAADRGAVALRRGDLVRGPAPAGPYHDLAGDGSLAEATETRVEALWPGDVISLDGDVQEALVLDGRGTYFEVTSEQTAYPAPKLTIAAPSGRQTRWLRRLSRRVSTRGAAALETSPARCGPTRP